MAKKITPKSSPAVAPVSPVAAPVAAAGRSEVKGSGTAVRAAAPVLTHDAIAKRAYQIYASRGYAAGNPQKDWHEAERQLRAGL